MILISIALYGIGIITGLVTAPDISERTIGDISDLAELGEFLTTLPDWGVTIFILFKNISALLISYIFSPFFCLVPIAALLLNGWLIGYISAVVLQEESLSYLLTGLIPHGILEIPAFLFGEAVALSLGSTLVISIFNKEKREQLIPHFRQNLKYLAIALAILVPAAIIEAYVTPALLE